MQDAELLYVPVFYSAAESQLIMEHLITTIPWSQETLNFGGKRVLVPRLQAWYGDAAVKYGYSGLRLTPLPWTSTLVEIKTKIESSYDIRLNSVLLNYYRNGQDSVAWHSDNETELGPDPLIASLSLGIERKFELKRRDGAAQKVSMVLANGSLLLMGSGLQRYWSHQIPKQPWVMQPRINLTFRFIY
ncbi:MAG: alpha-ketoglutarate-dependent dioxygenase AlkB [Pseudomonadota bacterium]